MRAQRALWEFEHGRGTHSQWLVPRESKNSTSDNNDDGGGPNTGLIVAGITVVVVIVLLTASVLLLRALRARNASPKYIPTQALKDRWRKWVSVSHKNRGKYSSRFGAADADLSSLPSTTPDVNASSVTVGPTRMEQDLERRNNRNSRATNDAPVDRQTSVRSVMTLPAYSAAARESEQTLGREGERGGIDVVLEFPETADDEEQRRDDEMESLYQIRLARRAEAAEREERRRRRREARDRGDWAEVERLRLEARDVQQRRERELLGEDPVNGNRSAARLIAEHQEETARRERQRRVSAAQYAGIGDVRHDGSRLRATSNASARSDTERPLLDSAADMGAETSGGRRDTLSTLDAITLHNRNRSTSSVMSVSTFGTDDDDGGSMYYPPFAPPVTTGHSRGRSGSGSILTTNTSPDFEVVTLHSSEPERADAAARPQSRNASASRLSQSVSATTGAESGEATESVISPTASEPPHYEHLAATEFGEPPEYQTPVSAQPPQLFDLERLPSITIEESRTPVRESGDVVHLPFANSEHTQN